MIKANEAMQALKPNNRLWRGQVCDFSEFVSIASGEGKQRRNSMQDLLDFHLSNLAYDFVTTHILWDRFYKLLGLVHALWKN